MLLGFFQDLPTCVNKHDHPSKTLPSFPAPAPTIQFAPVISTTPVDSSLGHIKGLVFCGCFPVLVPTCGHLLTMSSFEVSLLLCLASHRELSLHRGRCPRVPRGRAVQLAHSVAASVCFRAGSLPVCSQMLPLRGSRG